MKKQPADLHPLITRVAASSTAIATALVAPFAHAASGDLDPAFADHGRQGPIAELKGAARSIEAPDEGGVILGGGYLDANCRSCWYDIYLEASNFIDALSEDGAIDSAYDAGVAAGIEVFDIARQDDGNVVAVGRRVGVRNAAYNKLAVFRLAADGPLDAGFGDGGVVELDSGRFGEHNQASAVLVEPNGSIVIAGARNEELIVLRLNADGSLDGSFGESGAFAGPAHDYDSSSRIARVSSGGYRVTTTSGGACRILALTAKGRVDTSYGAGGYAEVAGDLGGAIACHSIAAQADDRLVVAGAAAGQPFAVRLLASGAPDPSFTAPDIALTLQEAAAIAVAADGKIVVAGAGEGLSGATIMRLQATGQLDAPFGQSGATHIDLPSEYGARPVIHDLVVRSDGSVLAAGGDYASSPVRPFAVRLLGDAGGESPGVLSVVEPFLETAEDGEVAISVRRTGGGSGEVSIAYRTTLDGDLAVPGQDYEEKSGRLHWDDGDTGERTVIVPVLAGDDEPEEYESFKLRLSDAEGGVGIGTQNAVVTILPDGAPAGQFALQVYEAVVYESGVLGLSIVRNFYDQGEACVTLTTRAGSAVGGDDFAGDPATICWDNGQLGEIYAEIQIVDDKRREGDETFEVVLSNPTGGAILGPRATATVTIAANDDPVSVPPPSDGGGGAAGFLSLLALGLLEILRAARRVLRIRPGDMP